MRSARKLRCQRCSDRNAARLAHRLGLSVACARKPVAARSRFGRSICPKGERPVDARLIRAVVSVPAVARTSSDWRLVILRKVSG